MHRLRFVRLPKQHPGCCPGGLAQLDQQHADVLAHGEQELAQVFRRALVLGHLLDLRELGHPVDQPRANPASDSPTAPHAQPNPARGTR